MEKDSFLNSKKAKKTKSSDDRFFNGAQTQQILFDAESKTNRYHISILTNTTKQKCNEDEQSSYIAFNINSALHNIIDGKTYIVRENFERPAKPISSELVRNLMQDIKTSGSMATLEVTTKFNAKYRIDANLSINISDDLIGKLDKTLSSLVTGKSVRKELELVCNENDSNTRDAHSQKHVWFIKSNEDSNEGESSTHRKRIFFNNDDTAVTLVVVCEVVITNQSSLSGLNLHEHKDGRSKIKLQKAIEGCKDIGIILNETLLHNNDFRTLENLSDIKLVAGKKCFKVHKIVLAMSSKVLAKTFLPGRNGTLQDLNEAKSGTIVLKEFDSETVEKMIHFIYKGYLEKSYYKSIRLLTLANKYDIVKLKLHCQAALIDTLDIETAISLWRAAKVNSAQFLQDASEEFMYDYWDKGLQTTEEFRNMNPKEGMGILSSIIAIAKSRKSEIEP